ncbi:MAG: type II toxin-antitoxin system VapC family toxin [Alphaproteobacteria bacterium]|nr:type II toxin-antitoxin system VapC family toxin [Alphaproteobacteria bacterium]MBU0797711.1 type II toxin-antitoxin system VapC family toxin [Alphaproteobacteria bacterium]MBU0885896.1 type II toxin-antitoxin system VapC family toxin [Alphaproteobacteria bacterium]MBU1814604.1 type II toxin-antitoxin system VapC family toxin [Alphaproteobacteria bacterium]MBU2091979.1 type II toxin-antitoxin system VapC family toxin [Alphaproteobacteria bacterium]
MIAVDTSALMAIVMNEPQADACMTAIEQANRLLISAGTVAEALIVADRRNIREEVDALISGLGFEIVPVTAASARRIADAYGQWGKGMHPAALNYGDCFAYAMAMEHGCPLLYVGNDFSLTDVSPAL